METTKHVQQRRQNHAVRFYYVGRTGPEQSYGNDSRDRSGSGIQDRSIVVDESAPLVHGSSTSHRPYGRSVVCPILCIMWVSGIAAILHLWFGFAPATGSRTRDWQDDRL
ncbi:hypothetical protein MTO96_045845 [Rhipicephalus appendiculatus]